MKTSTIFKFLCGAILTGGVLTTDAATFVVSNSNNTGAGSLRNAVGLASSGDTLIFAAATNNMPILLTSGEITLDKNLVISGNGISNTIIDANNNGRAFNIPNPILTNYQITITGIGFKNGKANLGGAINIKGNNLDLANCDFSNNVADSSGGAIYVDGGNLVVNNTNFNRNEAKGNINPKGGGAIFSLNGNLTIDNNCLFFKNTATGTSGSGGAIFNAGGGFIPGSMVINNSTFAQNTAKRAGGAIEDNVGAGTVLIDSTMMDSNMVMSNPGNGGAIHITGASNFNITNSEFTDNIASAEGGALWNGTGTMTVNNSILTGNIASGNGADQGGGGIYNLSGNLIVNNNTIISGNSADGTSGSGGGILNDNGGSLTVTNSQLMNNTAKRAGGAIEDNSGATTTILLTDVMINNNSTASAPGNGGALHITGAGNATILRATMNNNMASAEGGALWNGTGTMNVDSSSFDNNMASGAPANQGGGAIYSLRGLLIVANSTLTNNAANGAAGSGGAILIDSAGALRLTNSTLTGNSSMRAGGAIEDNSGAATTLILTNNNINNNTTGNSPGNGGGIHITGAGDMTISGGTVNSNTASSEGGGLWNGSGLMTVSGVTVNGNTASGNAISNGGGGIFNNGGELVVNASTVSNNIADGTSGNGGGIHNDMGIMTLNNNTISGNSSLNVGGGVFNRGKANLESNTIAFNLSNSGSGFAQSAATDTLIISSSIVAKNTSAFVNNDISDVAGSITSNGYNLIGKTDANTFVPTMGDTVGTLNNPVDPKIDTLANNGGTTLTHRLQCASPAINSGDPALTNNDQRGLGVFLNRRDMGSFERQDSCITSSIFANKLDELNGSKIYPNPISTENLTIDIPQEFGTSNTVRVIEVATGRILLNTQLNYGIQEINTSDYSNGIYVVQVISGNAAETHRLVISK